MHIFQYFYLYSETIQQIIKKQKEIVTLNYIFYRSK